MILFSSILVLAEITLGSWNLKWFPSGRAEHRASVRVEKANFQDAADVIREGTKSRGYILFFQEVRDAKTVTNLVNYIGNANLHPGRARKSLGDSGLELRCRPYVRRRFLVYINIGC